MAVESNRGGLVGKSGAGHWSPVGMRVLAVDDNETCLQILETMLKQCQYQVTTASHAEVALRLLKENPNRFDLVITDVKMPDTDGFELLEMVGLEMDLPVIMLSAHSDSELVMRAVTHGACDYLLKPVRMEELKNIWQHVIRRKKLEPDDQIQIPLGQGTSSGQSDNSNGKRKDHSEEEDSSRHKKPRVNWTQDKHQKFLIAVTQLGFDKAVPKKILDLMNVEGLTRENVASHLQKYRISLKKMQAKMAAQGGMSSSYMRMAALDGFRDVRSLDASLSSYPQGGQLSRLNSLAGLRMQGVTRPALIQPSLSQNLNNSFSCLQSPVLPSNQSSSLFQIVPNFKEFNSTDDPAAFVSNSIPNARSNLLVTLNMEGFGNLRHQSFVEFGAAGLSNAQLVNFPCNSSPFGQGQTFPLNTNSNSLMDPFSPSTCHIPSDRIEMLSTGADSSQRELIGNVVQKFEDHGPDYNYGMDNNTMNSLHPLLSSSDGVMDQNNLGTLLERTKSHDVFMESLDGLMNTLDKRDVSATTLLDGEYI